MKPLADVKIILKKNLEKNKLISIQSLFANA